MTVEPRFIMKIISPDHDHPGKSGSVPGPSVFDFEFDFSIQIKTGLIMNLISVLITVMATSTWIYAGLGLSEYPCWADSTDNVTCPT